MQEGTEDVAGAAVLRKGPDWLAARESVETVELKVRSLINYYLKDALTLFK